MRLAHGGAIEKIINARFSVKERTRYVIDTFALEPTRVWCGESLLRSLGDLSQGYSETSFFGEKFTIARFFEIALAFSAGLVFVKTNDVRQIAELCVGR